MMLSALYRQPFLCVQSHTRTQTQKHLRHVLFRSLTHICSRTRKQTHTHTRNGKKLNSLNRIFGYNLVSLYLSLSLLYSFDLCEILSLLFSGTFFFFCLLVVVQHHYCGTPALLRRCTLYVRSNWLFTFIHTNVCTKNSKSFIPPQVGTSITFFQQFRLYRGSFSLSFSFLAISLSHTLFRTPSCALYTQQS